MLPSGSISHLPDRFGTLSEWSDRSDRTAVSCSAIRAFCPALSPQARLTSAEAGSFVLVPPTLDEETIEADDLILLKREDRTAATAEVSLVRRPNLSAASLKGKESAEWFRWRQCQQPRRSWPTRRLSHSLYLAEAA
jgi:hypothetical protein